MIKYITFLFSNIIIRNGLGSILFKDKILIVYSEFSCNYEQMMHSI